MTTLEELEKNIEQTIDDFDDIKAAIEEQGVEVPEGTDTKEYGNSIRKIQGGSVDQTYNPESEKAQSGIAVAEAMATLPIKFVESPDADGNILDIFSMQSGTYILSGKFRPYPEASNTFTFSSGQLVAIRQGTISTVAQVFYPPNNAVQYLNIYADEESETGYTYERKDAKLYYMEDTRNKVTAIDEDSTDEQYPSAKAVHDKAEATKAEITATAQNLYSNILRGSASGEVIRVDDVNPFEHTVKAKVKSKNLIPFPYDEVSAEKSGLTFTVQNDGGINISGTPTENVSFNLVMQYKKRLSVEKGKTYTISVISTLTETTGYVFFQNWANGEVVVTKSLTQGNLTFVATENGYVQIGLVLLKEQTYDEVVYIQFEEGDTATEYTPYVDTSTVTVTRCGKNIASTNEYVVSHSYAWANTSAIKTTAPKGNYVAKCKFSQNGEVTTVCMSVRDYDNYTAQLNEQCSFDAQGTLIVPFTVGENCNGFQIYLYSNMTETALAAECVFSDFQIEIGDTATDFEAYNGSTYTPEADGTVNGVVSTSPTMTLLTDTAGVIIEAEYNQDINAAFDQINTILETLLNGGA